MINHNHLTTITIFHFFTSPTIITAPALHHPAAPPNHRASSSGATSPFAVSDFLFREDLYSLGYVFLELVFGAFCESKSKRPDQNSLKRLLEDIFKGDFKAFKVCTGGGWGMVAWGPRV